MKRVKKMWLWICGLPLSVVIAIGVMNVLAKPVHQGVQNKRLGPLPSSPNCVSTQTTDPDKKMNFIPVSTSAAETVKLVAQCLAQRPEVTIVQQTDEYLHAEFRSSVFRFVDDVEFFVDENQGALHFRSASRIGHSDLGVNRSRMQQLSTELTQRLKSKMQPVPAH